MKIEKKENEKVSRDGRILREGCEKLGIVISKEQMQQFEMYYDLLVQWNEVMNLTAITEYDEVMQKHFVDSLALCQGVKIEDLESLIDIGTGAGFPGIPLKIMYPHLKVVLLDSLNKRIKFLNEVIEKLGLKDITALHGRAEDFAKQKEYRENFDLCVSRAVANLSSLSEYCIPYVKKGGMFVSYKSGAVEEELEMAKKAIFLLGGEKKEVVKFTLPDSDIERSLVLIEKVQGTPKKYPRKAGLPAKEPL
jgi:16S rRNA (guanine527-N7)-methyltransferase